MNKKNKAQRQLLVRSCARPRPKWRFLGAAQTASIASQDKSIEQQHEFETPMCTLRWYCSATVLLVSGGRREVDVGIICIRTEVDKETGRILHAVYGNSRSTRTCTNDLFGSRSAWFEYARACLSSLIHLIQLVLKGPELKCAARACIEQCRMHDSMDVSRRAHVTFMCSLCAKPWIAS